MWTLMLSRSRRHGLRDDQSCVMFEFSWDVDSMAVTVRNRAEQSTLIASVSVSDEIHSTLNRLLEIAVD